MNNARLTCGHCGAGIEVAATSRFATCAHCGARLAIHHAPAASYSEVLQQVRARSTGTASDLERVQLQHELEKIDLAWQMRSRRLIADPQEARVGKSPDPSILRAIALAVLVFAWGLVPLLVAVGPHITFDTSWVVPLVLPLGTGVSLVLVGFAGAAASKGKNGPQMAYDRERAEIVRRLEALESGAGRVVGIQPPAGCAPLPEVLTVEALTPTCNQCGGPVTVAPGAQTAVCSHCGARLAVHRSASAYYTEVVEQIQRRAEQAHADIDTLLLQHQLEELEMRWKVQRDDLMVRDRDGNRYRPTRYRGVSGVVGVLLGVAALALAVSVGGGVAHQWMVAAMGLLGMINTLSICSNYRDGARQRDDAARRFEEAERSYWMQREDLVAKLNTQKSARPPVQG
jgi:DNA-directed RNA polymerase subunit RPC12/RpoP